MKLLTGSETPKVGDHVQLRGLGLTGYSGTIIRQRGLLWYVELDAGQVRAGHTVLCLNKRNIRKD